MNSEVRNTTPSTPPSNYRYISRKRRPSEDGRFIRGRGNFVQDIKLANTAHVAVVQSPHARARIRSIRLDAALALPGVVGIVTGEEIARATDALYQGIVAPHIRHYPLAHKLTRYAGEWVAAVVAESRYTAEDAAALIDIDYEPLQPVVDPELAINADSPLVHPDHGSNVLLHKHFSWGTVEEDFKSAPHQLSYRARWGRSSGVPIETFGVITSWNDRQSVLEVWASIQMPQYQEQIADALRLAHNAVKVHNDVDVGGSFGTKRGIKHTVLCGYLTRRFCRPIRFIEDRLEYMSGGDAHGPDRIFDVTLAYESDGLIRSMKIRALDDVGAYAGRAVQQLGKPISAICGPYRVNSVAYEAIAVATNKTAQVPMRGFGQAPTNFAIETGVDKVARALGLSREQVRRRNFIAYDEFPWRIPSGTAYDSGDYHTVLDKALSLADWPTLIARRDRIRASGKLAGVGLATCVEPGGGNNIFEHLLNERIQITTFVESALLKIDAQGGITVVISTHTAGQGHQTLAATIAGEVLERDPDTVRVVHADSLEALPTRGPVASRMAIMLGSAVAKAAERLREKMLAIAAHVLSAPAGEVEYADGIFQLRGMPQKQIAWSEIAFVAHRQLHRMPADMEAGLQVLQVQAVPGGGQLPNSRGEVQIYPCFSFQAHVPLVEIDPDTGVVTLHSYAIAHDCGTVINPDIVRGMILGGIAHGIGAALYEKFDYDENGQLLSGSFLDYIVPSANELPCIQDTPHCTPSPLTSHGQKGSGEGGYLGAPAAVASAINDALAPLGIAIDELPIRPVAIEAAMHHKAAEHAG